MTNYELLKTASEVIRKMGANGVPAGMKQPGAMSAGLGAGGGTQTPQLGKSMGQGPAAMPVLGAKKVPQMTGQAPSLYR